MKVYTVHAQWDQQAKVWWTDGEDIPGLTCQGINFDELVDVVLRTGPELLRDNKVETTGATVTIVVVAVRGGTTCIAA